jgi:hypothetical protein
MSKFSVFIETEEGPKKYEFDRGDFIIDPSNVEFELCNTAAVMLDYGRIEAQLKAEVESKEAIVYQLELTLDTKLRQDAAERNAKITEAKIITAVKGHEDRIGHLQSISRSKHNLNTMRVAMEALKSKRDCLLALSHTQRQLMKADNY